MKKTLLVLALLFSIYFTASAQDDALQPRVSLGAGFGAAVGGNTAYYPVGIQLNVKFEYPLSDSQLAIVAGTGFSFFTAANGYNYTADSYGSTTTGDIATFVPVQLGARYYISKLFIEGDAGASFNLGSTASVPVTKTAVVLTPSVGYGFRFGSSQRAGLDLSVGYDARLSTPANGASFNQVFFKVAFSLGL
ncbi:hypothetical protein ACFGVR_08875 [Mucilaginibacter sp. AW1-3]